MSAKASARFRQRRADKDAEAFATSALAEARKHSHSTSSLGDRSVVDKGESWHMTHGGELRVENEVGAYEMTYEQDIHESGLFYAVTATERTRNAKECFFRKDMEEQGVA